MLSSQFARGIVGLADERRDLGFSEPGVHAQAGRAKPLFEDGHVNAQHVGGALHSTPGRANGRCGLLHVESERECRAMRRRTK